MVAGTRIHCDNKTGSEEKSPFNGKMTIKIGLGFEIGSHIALLQFNLFSNPFRHEYAIFS